jgi:hypothetical protein
MSLLYLGMRITSANLVFRATFSATAEVAADARRGVQDLARSARSRHQFLDGLEALAAARGLVLDLGPAEHDEVAFLLWDPAEPSLASLDAPAASRGSGGLT